MIRISNKTKIFLFVFIILLIFISFILTLFIIATGIAEIISSKFGFSIFQIIIFFILFLSLTLAFLFSTNLSIKKIKNFLNQIRFNFCVKKLAKEIENKFNKKIPLENILLNINTNNFKALAKALTLSLPFKNLADAEKEIFFKNKDVDFIFHVISFWNEKEQIAIISKLDAVKRKNLLLRYTLRVRHEIEEKL